METYKMAIYDFIVGKSDPKTLERYGCDHDVARRMPKSHITLCIASRFRDIEKVKMCSYNVTENIQNMTEPNAKI